MPHSLAKLSVYSTGIKKAQAYGLKLVFHCPMSFMVGSLTKAVGSIHFSLLAGRILFKDVRYHSSNQTIKIVKGQIQWRYWIRRPTSEEELNSLRGEDGTPCRLHAIHFKLVDLFLSPAFRTIMVMPHPVFPPRRRMGSV